MRPKKLYKYLADTNEDVLNKIITGNIRLHNRSKLNDLYDGILFVLSNLLKKSLKARCLKYNIPYNEHDHEEFITKMQLKTFKYGVCDSYSLSEVSPKKYNLLWSHYADGGKGVCFEYDLMNIEKNLFDEVHPVTYSEEYPVKLESFCNTEKVRLQQFKALLQKNEIWEYEREWRYLNFTPIFKDENDFNSFCNTHNIKQDNLNKSIDYHIGSRDIPERWKPSKIYLIKDFCKLNNNIASVKNIEVEILDVEKIILK